MKSTHATEETFVNTFVAREKRERWLLMLGSTKNRSKVLSRLPHRFPDDAVPTLIFEEGHLPEDVAAGVQKLLTSWRRLNPDGVCHVIAASELDGQSRSLTSAATDYEASFGAIYIVVADKLAFYFPSRSNIDKQPTRVLFRP